MDALAGSKRRIKPLPPEMAALIRSRDRRGFEERYGSLRTVLVFAFGPSRAVVEEGELHLKITPGQSAETQALEDRGELRLQIGTDLLFGPFANALSWGALFIGWSTLWLWLGKGRTPGKRLLRIRVVRLSGKPITLWDAFSRSGGYGASLATGMLGFLEAVWHPNRQAMHDRIAGTVVIRE